LEEMGEIKRVHGGAIGRQSLFNGLSLSEKEKIRIAEKGRIADYAVSLVKRGDVLIVDSGSTTLQFARKLKNLEEITVITNSLNVASEFSKSDNKVILTGGEMDMDSLMLTGPLADETLKNIFADKIFMGIDGVDFTAGLTTPDIVEAKTVRLMMQAAAERILLADSTKFGRKSIGVVSKVSELDKIITDAALNEEERRRFEEAGVEVILV